MAESSILESVFGLVGAGISGGVFTVIGQGVVKWWRRPKLYIDYGEEPEYRTHTPNRVTVGGIQEGMLLVNPQYVDTESILIRVRVRNEGWSVAKGCRVWVSEISRQNSDGSRDTISGQDSIALGWSLRPNELSIDIPKGLRQFADVCLTIKHPERPGLHFASPNFPDRFMKAWNKPGRFHVEVMVTAEGLDAVTRKIVFDWHESWDSLRPVSKGV